MIVWVVPRLNFDDLAKANAEICKSAGRRSRNALLQIGSTKGSAARQRTASQELASI